MAAVTTRRLKAHRRRVAHEHDSGESEQASGPAPTTAPAAALLSLQRRVGNRAVAQLVQGHGRPAPLLQRHSDAALKAQLNPLDDDDIIQAKRDDSTPAPDQTGMIRRHPVQPPVDSLKAARMAFRKLAQAKRTLSDDNVQEDIKQALRRFAKDNLPPDEFVVKKALIDKLQWTLDPSSRQPNPAVAGPGKITIYFAHENYYFPDGAPRTEFIKTVMLHEALHATSLNGQGFQGLDQSFTKNLKSDSLDEAVTDRLGSELADTVLGRAEKYTSQYWNVLGRKGLDFHLTSQGLDMLASSNPTVWLGDLVDVITAITGLTWPAIKRAYLTNEGGANDNVIAGVRAQAAAIETAWTAKRKIALATRLGPHAIAAATWETTLAAAVGAVDGARGAPANLTAAQMRAAVEAQLLAATGAQHKVVPKSDRRSSSKDDWAIMSRAGTASANVKPPVGGWKPTGTGMSSLPAARGAEETAVASDKAASPQHVKEYAGNAWSAIAALQKHVATAKRLLGITDAIPPLSWVVIPKPAQPDDPGQAKNSDRLSTYLSSKSGGLMQPTNQSQSIATLTGDDAGAFAHATVSNYGGAGYEANGDLALVTQEHTNLATVVHEMGHHKQKYEGFSEETVGGIPLLLDFHNIVMNENRLAADDIRTGKDANPYVRLRYTEGPVRLRKSEWQTLAVAKARAESDAYTAFRDRLVARGGKYGQLIQEIETGLADATLYPGDVAILFKNYMVDEIKLKKADVEFSDAS